MADLTPLLTISGAFGAAFAGQYLGHKLTRNRDTEKQNKESLQNLYSPLVYKIVDYIDIECSNSIITPNNFIDELEIYVLDHLNIQLKENTNDLFNNILADISEKLTYADQNLIMSFEIAKKYGKEFNYGQEKATLVKNIYSVRSRIELSSVFLSQYLKLNKQLKTLSKAIQDELEEPYFYTLVVRILLQMRLFSIAINYSFRDKDLIVSAFGIDKYLLEKAENLVKRHEYILNDLDDFSSKVSEELDVDSYAFLDELIHKMEYMDHYESDAPSIWRRLIEEDRNKEEKQLEDFLENYVNKDS
ncbi:hypothetical protein [Paenibacillus xylanexedens]|uniref:Uncharacterized protein n=1 Tax=Paenibacillus xylanexedens TaxID=528191 RepID=A0ABS4RR43_PAEXY|nr:hypothetical protein [Paenibacillus xylanexedens]MBP2244262.1 hypothetical protein [Paenibacillus xylanexedens]